MNYKQFNIAEAYYSRGKSQGISLKRNAEDKFIRDFLLYA